MEPFSAIVGRFTDRLHVEIGQRAAAGVGNVARGGVDGADFRRRIIPLASGT
jgi:hypothetical protein